MQSLPLIQAYQLFTRKLKEDAKFATNSNISIIYKEIKRGWKVCHLINMSELAFQPFKG
jgi:hypothetical protein